MYLRRKLEFFSISVFLVFVLFLGLFHENRLVDAFFVEGVRFQVRTLSSDSFESDVIESKDAWILAIKGSKVSEDEWQTEENKLRGVVNVAFIDLITDGQFMFEKVEYYFILVYYALWLLHSVLTNLFLITVYSRYCKVYNITADRYFINYVRVYLYMKIRKLKQCQ